MYEIIYKVTEFKFEILLLTLLVLLFSTYVYFTIIMLKLKQIEDNQNNYIYAQQKQIKKTTKRYENLLEN